MSTSNKPVVSVIVPVFNGERTIGRCIDSLCAQSMPRERFEVIVVDDGSTDATASILRAKAGIRAVHQRNAGPAAARNRGIKEASGTILVFTDADCRLDQDFLERLTAPLLERPDRVVAAQARYRTEQRSWVARLAQVEIEERYDHIRSSTRLTAIGTYGAAYWKDAVEAVGGFNQAYRVASGEDFALSYELTRHGKAAVFVPEAIVYHEHPDTLSRYYRSKRSRGYWRVLLRQQYPAESLQDSYVPRSLVVQVFAVAALPVSLIFGAMTAWTRVGGLGFGVSATIVALFIASGGSFFRRVWRADKKLLIGSAVFLFVRATAIVAGVVEGTARFGLRAKRVVAQA